MSAEQKEWYVVRTKPRKEEFALQNLHRREVGAFCPRIREPIGWATEWSTVPLFPGYLFVEIELQEQYHSVLWSPGVKSFVSFGSTPSSLQPDIVVFLQQAAGDDGIIRAGARFRIGDRVRIRRGPFAGLVAIIEKPCPERGRIRVLMDFLRHRTAVDLPIAAIGRI